MKSGKPKKAPKVHIQKGPSRNYMREADQMSNRPYNPPKRK